MTTDPIDAIMTKLAGVAGAFVSLKWVNGTWPEKIIMALGGGFLSYYAAPYASYKTEMPEGICGFLLGLLGMTVMQKLWEVIQVMPVNDFWASVIAWFKTKLS